MISIQLFWVLIATCCCLQCTFCFSVVSISRTPLTSLNAVKSSSLTSFQSSAVTVDDDFSSALSDLLQDWEISSDKQGIAFLFLSPVLADNLESIARQAQLRLGSQTQLLTVVGGGVVGPGQELEDSRSMSFLGGVLPENSSVQLFSVTNDDDQPQFSGTTKQESHLVFADPHCTHIQRVFNELENKSGGVVAGGISIAYNGQASLAIGDTVVPPGSLIGATFSGNLGVQVVMSHGCRPVGPTYRVTSVDGPAIHKLDGIRAIDQLESSMQEASDEDQEKMRDHEVLGGISHCLNQNEEEEDIPEDFILRQVTGFRPRSGSILVCGPQIQEGDYFRFHVRSADSALDDWQFVRKRAKTERLFVGDNAGVTLAALQISCLARGRGLYGQPNVDLHHVEGLLHHHNEESSPAIAGFFANAEIGPLGIRMGADHQKSKTYLHGYAAVIAMLCDYTGVSSGEPFALAGITNSTFNDAWG